jgi:hypothetical protein
MESADPPGAPRTPFEELLRRLRFLEWYLTECPEAAAEALQDPAAREAFAALTARIEQLLRERDGHRN